MYTTKSDWKPTTNNPQPNTQQPRAPHDPTLSSTRAPTLASIPVHARSPLADSPYLARDQVPAHSQVNPVTDLTQSMHDLSLQPTISLGRYPKENITANNINLWRNFSKIFGHLKDIYARGFEHCDTPEIDPVEHIKMRLCQRYDGFAFTGMEIASALVLLIKILDNMDDKKNASKIKYKLNNNPKPFEEGICVNDIGLLFFVALKFSKCYLKDMSHRQARRHPFDQFAFPQQKITENPQRCNSKKPLCL